jgi:hypothetical protein
MPCFCFSVKPTLDLLPKIPILPCLLQTVREVYSSIENLFDWISCKVKNETLFDWISSQVKNKTLFDWISSQVKNKILFD